LHTFKDRSYLSEVRPRSTEKKKVRERSIPVRVVEFDVTVRGRREHYRLITTLLDPRQATAMDLAKLYAKRWKIETIFDEIKDHRRRGGTAVALRSKRPDLVRQDFYGLLLAHFGVRSLMVEAAQEANVEPGCLSFSSRPVGGHPTPARNGFFSPLHRSCAAIAPQSSKSVSSSFASDPTGTFHVGFEAEHRAATPF
jgi:hypothetical protein